MGSVQNYWQGKRVTVMGLGVLGGGVGAARYLAGKGALVTVTDMRDETALADSTAQLAEWPITYHLGGHDVADFSREGADVVVRNPGVPMDSPYLKAAIDSGVAVEMEMSIFFRDCQAPIIGITGTKGKTTVSALIGTILTAWQPDALLAGNMGVSALLELDRLQPDTLVALELSSFQIESLNDHALAPQVSVITNIFPDHLDRYRDFTHYADTKRDMLRAMSASDVAVLNRDDVEAWKGAAITPARLLSFGESPIEGDGAWLEGDALHVRWNDSRLSFPRPDLLALEGVHGGLNALAAISACLAYGVPETALREGLASFKGVENRLEVVAVDGGITFVNDTSATAPAAATAALKVLGPRAKHLHLIAGGADKQTDLTPFADALRSLSVSVYLLNGTATPGLTALLQERNVAISGTFDGMAPAVEKAIASAQDGDYVVLSPACASFGMFRNEFDRGNQFRSAVLEAISV